jgi:ribosomal protein S18 acetylase RimI-like enzyme
MDIALLPERRGRGIGTRLLQELLDAGRASGRSVSIHVERENPARRLYERLGFHAVGEHGIHLLMAC